LIKPIAMDVDIDLFNSLPRPERAPSGLIDNDWHFSIRHVALEPPGDMIVVTNIPSRYTAVRGPVRLPTNHSEHELWIARARHLVNCFLTQLPGDITRVTRPWQWKTTDQETATKMEMALTSIGVQAPLNNVHVANSIANARANESWAEVLSGLYNRVGKKVPTSSTPPSKPRVMLLSLDHQPFFDEIYTDLIDALSRKAQIQRTTKPAPAVRLLTHEPPYAVIVTDPGISDPENIAVLQKLKQYQGSGGTVVVACLFGSFITFPEMNRFWREWDLPWESGAYTRSRTQAKSAVPSGVPDGIPKVYSPKALFLNKVDTRTAFWVYQPPPSELPNYEELSDDDEDQYSSIPTNGVRCAAVQYSFRRSYWLHWGCEFRTRSHCSNLTNVWVVAPL